MAHGAPRAAGAVEALTDRAAGLLREHLAGDPEAMGGLVDLLTPMLWHVARSCRLDDQAAEDAVQHGWLRLVEHAADIADPQAVVAWLVTTVRRESWRLARSGERTRPHDLGDPAAPPVRPLGARPVPDPAETVGLEERRRRLWEHVSALTPRCRELLRIICFAEAPGYASISRELGMPVGSIGPTRGRCLATLRAALQADPRWSV